MSSISDFIAGYEKFSPSVYLDPVGIPTIGYGETNVSDMRQRMSEPAARELLNYKINKIGKDIAKDFPTLSEAQKNAIVSLVYNVGRGNWKRSKAYKALKANKVSEFVSEAFSPEKGFVKAGGNVLPGLVKRRQDEMNMFLKGKL